MRYIMKIVKGLSIGIDMIVKGIQPISDYILVSFKHICFLFPCNRDVWQMYLERGEFELAKEYCKVSINLVTLEDQKRRLWRL